jgi:molybdopterin synthase catalytic subunit
MANPLCKVLLTKERIEAPKKGLDTGAGAVVEFWGVVRALEEGRTIEGIDYQAHFTMAEHQLQLIAEEAVGNFRLLKTVIQHRIGFVPSGEASLFLQIEAAHRAHAFDASRWIVDELKKRVPIWKHPKFLADLTATNPEREPGQAVHGAAK